MVFIEIPKEPEKTDETPRSSKFVNTAKEFASGTTIHGVWYIASSEHSTSARIFWVFVVILALSITAFQMLSLRKQWEANPVITNLETIALPIEEIAFPAVTICPQGSVKDILDNVLFHQLKEYVSNKNHTSRRKRSTSQDTGSELPENSTGLWNVTYDEMLLEMEDFMRDVYPGAKDIPTKFVTLMTSDDPKQAVENEAVVLPVQEEECDETSNRVIVNDLNKQLNNDFCPDGFTKFGNIGCVMAAESKMDYNEASTYCQEMDGASIIQLNSYEDIKVLDEHNIIGALM